MSLFNGMRRSFQCDPSVFWLFCECVPVTGKYLKEEKNGITFEWIIKNSLVLTAGEPACQTPQRIGSGGWIE